MSLHALNCALRYAGLSPTKKLVLVVLANYADETGSCYPSHKHIAEIVGLKDHKGVQKIIKGFEESGLLKVEKRYNGGGQTSNRYHLNLTKMVLEDISQPNPPLRAETLPLPLRKPPNTKDKPKMIDIRESLKSFGLYIHESVSSEPQGLSSVSVRAIT